MCDKNSIKRDAREVGLYFKNHTTEEEFLYASLEPGKNTEYATKSAGGKDSIEHRYNTDATHRFWVDKILDEARVLMPSAEEVVNVYRVKGMHGVLKYCLSDFISEKTYTWHDISSLVGSNSQYFKIFIKCVRAAEAKADGVDVNLSHVVESCKPQSKTAQESTMSQTKTFRVKTPNGDFRFTTDGNGHVEISCDCKVNNKEYSKSASSRIVEALSKAMNWEYEAERIEDI